MVTTELLELERQLASLLVESGPEGGGIGIVQATLQSYIDPDCISAGRTLCQSIEFAANSPQNRRNAVMIVLRALDTRVLFEDLATGERFERQIIKLVEQGAPDICKYLRISDFRQNYEKIQRMEGFHEEICAKLFPVATIGQTINEFMSSRQDVLKALRQDIVKSYLSFYNISHYTNSIQTVFESFEKLQTTRNHEFPRILEAAKDAIDVEIKKCKGENTFLSENYIAPFFAAAETVGNAFDEEARGKFVAKISTKLPANSLVEKRYPLHDEGRTIGISIALLNEGPGIAAGVTAQISTDTDDAITNSKVLRLGDIPPGEFVIFCEILIIAPVKEIELWVEVEWGQILSVERNQLNLTIPVKGQATDIPWDELADSEPYSLEVAEGEEFVGRHEKVRAIASRLQRPRMVSTYITGQKRIGKSSLSLAVKDYLKKNENDLKTEFLFLDRGDYAHEDPRTTLKQLGDRVAEFLTDHAPPSMKIFPLNFDGSLAPLTKLADQLQEYVGENKFVVVLDEFDGIHPELYRMGALAETFFSNMRTLSAKKNMAFILVGGENMPFIISAQGDELNKFARESLTYFSRITEWPDFKDLVMRPVEGKIMWYESALNALFNWTNGHPYYTKLVCAEVFRGAIQDKDAEITSAEVDRGVSRAIGLLDTNAFAHLWKDGTGESREGAEVVALRRCRVLLAAGRTLRLDLPLTVENIANQKGFGPLINAEIAVTMQDFVHRGIADEDRGTFTFALPIFREWLKQSGVNIIIPDRGADELASEIKVAEDRAYVQDNEIFSVVSKWPSYNGREITAAQARTWLDQVPVRSEQRLLFKLLSNITFYSDIAIREALQVAHRSVSRSLPIFTKKHRSERRSDVIVTYLDGPGKSGSEYASRYAEENSISAHSVFEMTDFGSKLRSYEEKYNTSVSGLIVVDDIIGTGRTLSDNLQTFYQRNREAIALRNPALRVVALCATPDGQSMVRRKLASFDTFDADLITVYPLGSKHMAFHKDNSFWASPDELDAAKALCKRLSKRTGNTPALGFGDMGLLVVFPNTCPNNTLPIFHETGKGEDKWTPIFPRPKN